MNIVNFFEKYLSYDKITDRKYNTATGRFEHTWIEESHYNICTKGFMNNAMFYSCVVIDKSKTFPLNNGNSLVPSYSAVWKDIWSKPEPVVLRELNKYIITFKEVQYGSRSRWYFEFDLSEFVLDLLKERRLVPMCVVIPTRFLDRFSSEYETWRRNVLKRDNETCQCCGRSTNYLEVHHINSFLKYPELQFDVSNGITLCKECHNVKYEGSFHYQYGVDKFTKEDLQKYIDYKRAILNLPRVKIENIVNKG